MDTATASRGQCSFEILSSELMEEKEGRGEVEDNDSWYYADLGRGKPQFRYEAGRAWVEGWDEKAWKRTTTPIDRKGKRSP